MTEERLEQALGGGIGLSNVNERLRTIYGASYQLRFTSVPGQGTCGQPRNPGTGHPRARDGADRWICAPCSSTMSSSRGTSWGSCSDRSAASRSSARRATASRRSTTIGRLQPDVVFLDVQMPGLTGFEVARRLIDAHAPSHIIFVTAYDQHAIEAFEVNAVDYLLKPVDPGAARTRRSSGRAGASRSSGRPDRATDAPAARQASPPSSSRDRRAASPSARTGATGWPSRSASASSSCRPTRSSSRRWPTTCITVVDQPARRHVELPDARRAAGAARPGRLLARPPLASGEHQQDQGDRPLVQSELHPEDERREGDGNPGQPHADAGGCGST